MGKKRRREKREAAVPLAQPEPGEPPPPRLEEGRPGVVPLLRAIESLRGSRVIAFYSDPMEPQPPVDPLAALAEQLSLTRRRGKIDLWLFGSPGTTETAWRLVQSLRRSCSRLGVLVPDRTSDVGTQLALGADEIVMGRFAVLCPLGTTQPPSQDQRSPGEGVFPFAGSALELRYAVEFVKREFGVSLGAAEALFARIHPFAVGALEQGKAVSKAVARRMLATHMTARKHEAEIRRIVDALSDDYPSPSFPIGLSEARGVGLKATEADAPLDGAMRALLRHYRETDAAPQVAPPAFASWLSTPGAPGRLLARPVSYVDSAEARFTCFALGQEAEGRVEPRATRWLHLQR
jgi:hypothetical protein